jgi:hypothetical protein
MKNTDEKRKILRTGRSNELFILAHQKLYAFLNLRTREFLNTKTKTLIGFQKKFLTRKKEIKMKKSIYSLNPRFNKSMYYFYYREFRRVKLFQTADTNRCFKPELNVKIFYKIE